jgi:hypothetical protein
MRERKSEYRCRACMAQRGARLERASLWRVARCHGCRIITRVFPATDFTRRERCEKEASA